MKYLPAIPGVAMSPLLFGCATAPLALAPVGHNPAGVQANTTSGKLEVFSALEPQSEGDTPFWYQHEDYVVRNLKGKRVRYVDNSVGYYESAPRIISLPPGRYRVRANAADGRQADIPVVIEPGRITRVHLDDHWSPPPDAPQREFVFDSHGTPVGWHADLTGG